MEVKTMKRTLVAMLLFLVSIVSFAAGGSLIVKKVEVLNNQEVPASIILNQMDLKEGKPFSTEVMLHDFQTLKKSKYLEDVLIQPQAYEGGVNVVVNVIEKKDAQSLLREDGVISMSEQANVDKSLILSDIIISGNQFVSTTDLKEVLPVKQGGYFSKAAIEDGQKALLATGYFREVAPSTQKDGNGVKVIYTVVENPVIQGINIHGNTLFSTPDILKVLKTKTGEVLNINSLRADRDTILNLYQDQGYTLSEISDMGLNDRGELEVVISEGIIRNVSFQKMVTKQKGNRRKPTDDILKTQDYVIQREIELQEGKIYNSKDYDNTVQNLMRLGVFKNIKSEIRRVPGDPNGRDIVLLIDEDRTAILQGAISYGSETGLMGTLSLKDNNWKGRAQEFGVNFEKSNKDYTGFTIDFFDPWIRDTDRISWGWSLYKTSYGDSDSALFNDIDTIGAKINVGKGFARNWRFSLGLKGEYVKEKANKGNFRQLPDGTWQYTGKNKNDASNAPLPKDAVNDKYMVFSVFPYLTYDTRNNPWNATTGEYAKLQLETGYAGGYKSGSFSNVTLELRKYHRGFWKKNTFAYKMVGGIMTQSTKEGQRFWVGGGNTLRGYDGGTFRGTQKLTATIENRTQINDILGIVFFADAGRAWKQNGRDPAYGNDEKFSKGIATTAGVGLRLNTPMGPLRFDFGWPVGRLQDKYSNDRGMKFYFNMGQSF